MAPNANAETLALGLNADHLVGKSADDIRHAINSDDAALITVSDGIPRGWPSEIFAIDRERDQVDWHFQTADGEWKDCCSFANFDQFGKHQAVCALIYTRRPVASPSVRVRPIVALHFDVSGVCQSADASWIEDIVRAALENDLPKLRTPKAIRVLGDRDYKTVLEHVERILGIAPPRHLVEARDFAADERGMTPIGLAFTEEGNALAILDAQMAQRIAVQLNFVLEPYLYFGDQSGRWPDLAVGSDGYRIELIDPSGVARKWIDVVSNFAGLVVVDEAGSAWSVLAWLAFEPCPVAYQAGEDVFMVTMLTTRRQRDPARVDEKKPARMQLDRQAGTLDLCDETGAAKVEMKVAECQESSVGLAIVARMKLEVRVHK
ncbi:MAG: hypothetical protein HYR85_26260 [Planctomycetes bacterium]|nr:hypothetical protein [Planctomycetota bacterium]